LVSNSNSIQAKYNLAILYEIGKGIEKKLVLKSNNHYLKKKNLEEISLDQKAAVNEHIEAQNNL